MLKVSVFITWLAKGTNGLAKKNEKMFPISSLKFQA